MENFFAVTTNQLADQLAALLGADQLAQDGTNRGFEAVPTDWQTQPGIAPVEFGEQRHASETVCQHHRIGIEIEHSSHPADDLKESFGIAGHHAQAKLRAIGQGLDA